MINKVRASLWLIPLTLISIILWPAFSYADSPAVDLTSSPISLSLPITPGSSYTTPIEVMNNAAKPVTINMKLDKFGAVGTSGLAQIITPKANDISATWVTFSPQTFVAQPGVWSKVQMTINLPSSAQLGYYYVAVFQPVENVKTNGPSTIVKGSNGVLVLVDTHSSNEKRQVQVASFTTNHGVYEYLPVNFKVNIHNAGNIYVAPYGDIYISRSSVITSSISSLPVNSSQGNILPHSNRIFNASWTSGFPVYVNTTKNGQTVVNKKGVPIQKLDWNFSNLKDFRFGKYYAQLTLVYSNGLRPIPIYGVVSFWVIPWKLMLFTLFLLLIIGAGLWSMFSKIYKNVRKVPVPKKKKK